jgi:ribonuclease BN (tRNA processing enzyme)
MRITPLGVGEAFAKTLFQTNYLITPADGEPFLIDCGHTASRSLHTLGLSLASAPTVVLSHLHADHIGGLEELGFTGYFVWGVRPVLHVPRGLLPLLWEGALQAGMGQRLRGPGRIFFDAGLETYFDVRPVETGAPIALGSVYVNPFPTPHVPGRSSWGFRLEDRATGKAAMLTCDSRFHRKNLQTYGAGAEAIFHDCQLTSNGRGIHATLEELMALPPPWQEKTILVHYGDDWRSFEGRTGRMRFGRERTEYDF